MSCYAKAFEFYPGEHKTLSIQVNTYDRASGCTEPMDLTGVSALEVEIPASPDNIILTLVSTPPVVIDQAILGKIHMDLTNVQTDIMESGSIIVRPVLAGKLSVAVAEAACRRLIIPNC